MNINTVCGLLELAIQNNWENEKQLLDNIITDNYLQALNSESFREIDEKTLEYILKLNPVSEDNEYQIFGSTIEWTKRACEKDEVQVTGSLQRKKLGACIKLIRFASMTNEEFGNCVMSVPDLLTNEEISAIFLNIATKQLNNLGFSDEKRFIKIDENNTEIEDDLKISDYDGFEYFRIDDFKQKEFFIVFRCDKKCELSKISLYLPKRNHLSFNYALQEDGKIIRKEQKDFIELMNGNGYINIKPIKLDPMKFYKIKYHLSTSNVTFEKYGNYLAQRTVHQKDDPVIRSSNFNLIKFTVYHADSHISYFKIRTCK